MEQLPTAVRRFLDGLQSGDWTGMEQHFTPDAVQDGSMPGWRVRYAGPGAIVAAYREEWTGRGTWKIQVPAVTQSSDTVAIEMEARLVTPDDSLVCRIANFFSVRDGRIAEHRYYCCGEWTEETVRRIEAQAPGFSREQALS